MSPSALSQGLAELERRVGVDLFERHGRRRVLRPSALPVLDHARQVVALTRDLLEWSDRIRTARAGRVPRGHDRRRRRRALPRSDPRLPSERRDVELTLSVAPSAALLDHLRDGRLDLVVCVEPPEPPAGIDLGPLLSEPLMVIAPPGTDDR